jgi:hypothetical protein
MDYEMSVGRGRRHRIRTGIHDHKKFKLSNWQIIGFFSALGVAYAIAWGASNFSSKDYKQQEVPIEQPIQEPMPRVFEPGQYDVQPIPRGLDSIALSKLDYF